MLDMLANIFTDRLKKLKEAFQLEKSTQLVSTYWGTERAYSRPAHWLDHPTTRALRNRRITGEPDVDGLAWLARRIGRGARRAMVLGCGFGDFTHYCLSLGLAEQIDAVDIADGAIKQARARAEAAQLSPCIRYEVADLNRIVLPPASYDLIFSSSAVHHVEQLERLFTQCHQALKPDGWLFLDEYIGPSRFQSPPAALETINALLMRLPKHYRRSAFNGATIEHIAPPPFTWFAENDPSEAVRSADIIAALTEEFEIVEFRPYGGAILHLLLSGIAGNFDETDEHDVALLGEFEATERRLEAEGIIGSDFAVILARPRPT